MVRKEEVNSIYRRYVYVKIPKKSVKTLLDLIIEFSKIFGYNIGIYK